MGMLTEFLYISFLFMIILYVHVILSNIFISQSTWNQKNIFIGMTDTPLTEDGILEARVAGRLLAGESYVFDKVYTSLLRRSTKTVWLIMQELGLGKFQYNIIEIY